MGRQTFKKKITNEDTIAKVNPKNIKLGERFLRQKSTKCSKTTINNYRSDLNIFWCWNFANNDDTFFTDIAKFEFADFFAYGVGELKWGSERYKRMRSVLSSLSDFIETYFDKEYPEFRNVILKTIELLPKNARRQKTVLSQSQVDTIFKYYKDRKELQKSCLFALACFSGARKAELIRFTTDLIDVNNTAFDGIFLETTRAIKTKGHGDDGKMLNKYIIKDLFMPHYEAWLKRRAGIIKRAGIEDHGYIFIDESTGQPITSPNSVGRWLEDLESQVGVVVYCHCLRHYMATYLVKIGLDDSLIVHLFGWSSMDMLSIYNDLTAKDREWKCLDKLKEKLDEK